MTLAPIRRRIVVPAGPEEAFATFTDRIGEWWPLGDHGVFGAGAAVAFEDGRIVERSADGRSAEWGLVTRWDPPTVVGFTWHPGADAARASAVTVTFAAHPAGTLVTLEHDGWEVYADPAAAREDYRGGWPTVLGLFTALVGTAAAGMAGGPGREPGADTWVVLVHTPGPGCPPGAPVFSQPLFAEHTAFLGRMARAGYLVAAGPFADGDGGMTLLRLPGDDRVDDVRRLATEDDRSVAGGLFTVAVRSWQVVAATV